MGNFTFCKIEDLVRIIKRPVLEHLPDFENLVKVSLRCLVRLYHLDVIAHVLRDAFEVTGKRFKNIITLFKINGVSLIKLTYYRGVLMTK